QVTANQYPRSVTITQFGYIRQMPVQEFTVIAIAALVKNFTVFVGFGGTCNQQTGYHGQPGGYSGKCDAYGVENHGDKGSCFGSGFENFSSLSRVYDRFT